MSDYDLANQQCDTTECYVRWQNFNTERDMQLERAVAAEVEVARLRKVMGRYHAGQISNVEQLLAAEAKLAAIEALHQPHVTVDGSVTRWCGTCRIALPCPTHRILHPDTKERA